MNLIHFWLMVFNQYQLHRKFNARLMNIKLGDHDIVVVIDFKVVHICTRSRAFENLLLVKESPESGEPHALDDQT